MRNEVRQTPVAAGSRPLVAVLEDGDVRADRLRQVLERLRCNVVEVFPNASLEALAVLQRDADLVAVPVDPERPRTLERIRTLVATDEVTNILAFARPAAVGRCLAELRPLGIAGLLSTDAPLSHIEFRLNTMLDVFPERRSCERVSILMPVHLRASGVESEECGVSLSIAGMGIASRRPFEPNDDVGLELHPPSEQPIVLPGRVIHCIEDPASIPPFRIGVHFRDPSAAAQRRIESLINASTH